MPNKEYERRYGNQIPLAKTNRMGGGPIFIGGLSYSGKTQLRLMLSSHPNIVITRRTYMWTRFYGRFGDLSQPRNFERCLEMMLRHKHMHILHPDPERIRREFWQGPATYARLFSLFHEHFAERVGKARWGDQLGSVEQYADPIFSAYPSAQIIHMMRDPGERYKAILSRSAHRRGKAGWETAQWCRSAELAIRNRKRYPDRYKVVFCENLQSNPEETLDDICSFLNEEYFPEMLSMEGALRYGLGVEKRSEAHADPGSNPASRNGSAMISKTELAFIHRSARGKMLDVGYPVDSIRFSLKDWLLFLSLDWPMNRTSMAAWQLSHRSS